MTNSASKEKVSHLLEAISTALLFSTQTILHAGIFISIMSIPLLPYFYDVLSGGVPLNTLMFEIEVMLFSKAFWIGRIIALIGLVILVVSAVQLLWTRHTRVGIINTGMYSVVRHPQFTGIIIITVGLTIMVFTNSFYDYLKLIGLWLIQVLGYIGIALYEEWRLSRKFRDDYRQYKQKVPFLFPLKPPSWFPESLLTILIVLLICVVLRFLPYSQLRII